MVRLRHLAMERIPAAKLLTAHCSLPDKSLLVVCGFVKTRGLTLSALPD
jgi:hypothetical protein